MLTFTSGNLFESKCEAIVNAVNCVGVMGGGIALEFKNRFPEMYEGYVHICNTGELVPGKLHIFDYENKFGGDPRYIINLPTKGHYRNESGMQMVADGLHTLWESLQELGIKSVAIPALGCGLGGLKWGDVKPVIEDTYSEHFSVILAQVNVLVYEPFDQAGVRQPVRKEPDFSDIKPEHLQAVIDHEKDCPDEKHRNWAENAQKMQQLNVIDEIVSKRREVLKKLA